MRAILIGGERRGVTFTALTRTWDDRNGSQHCHATASFNVDAASGECATDIEDRTLRDFVADLENMHRDLHGSATLWGGNPAGPNARAELKMEKGGKIVVDANFSDWHHDDGVGFRTEVQFAIDQSFLPQIAQAARRALQVFE